jgi:hypothetical protein
VPPPPDAPPPPSGDAVRRRHAGSRGSGVGLLQALSMVSGAAQDGDDVNVPHGVATVGGAGGGGDGEGGDDDGGGSNGSHAVCSIPDESGACEVYRLSYVADDWGVWVEGMGGARKGFTLIVLVDGEQVSQSPFRPDVYPPPSYPWFNSSSLQAPTDDWYFFPCWSMHRNVCVCVCVCIICVLGNTATSCT